ncbi:uncharacterized protein LOC129131659 isoform X4 [Agelaius phoeniceus]|uniref:uncharacterized protein LOC129131659 isoform X4 n=1 Tax=Agelaius phoeniceus TaxID=39638 RepID=UPI004055335C
MRRGLARGHRTHLWRRGRRGGGCAAPGARAPPAPRLCPRYATGNGAGALRAASSPGRNAGAGAALARSRLFSSCLPAERAEQPAEPRPRGLKGRESERRPRVPGPPLQQRVGLRARNCRRSERAAGAPSGLRQGDSGDARLRLGEAQRTAAAGLRADSAARPGPAPPGPEPRRGPGATCRPRCLRYGSRRPHVRMRGGSAAHAPGPRPPPRGPAHPRPAPPSARGRGAAGARPGSPPVPQPEPVPGWASEGPRRPAEAFSAWQSRDETPAGTKEERNNFPPCSALKMLSGFRGRS